MPSRKAAHITSSPASPHPLTEDQVAQQPFRDYRVADKLAIRIFRVLYDRSEAEQRLVLRATSLRLSVAQPEDRAEVFAALRACEAAVGHPPSRRAYREWTAKEAAENPDRTWPTDERIRALFGSWLRARSAYSGDPLGDIDARRLRHRPDRYEPEDLVAGVRDWWKNSDKSSVHFKDYVAATRRRLADAQEGTLRLCITESVFCDRLGGWPQALQAAGVLSEVGDELAARGQLIKGVKRHADEQVLDWLESFLRWAANNGLLGTKDEYKAWRARQMSDALRRGEHLPIPSWSTVRDRMGALARLVIRLADERPGSVTHDQLMRALNDIAEWTKADVAHTVVEAAESLGDDFGVYAFGTWRDARQRQLGAAVPSSNLVRRHFPTRLLSDAVPAARLYLAEMQSSEGQCSNE